MENLDATVTTTAVPAMAKSFGVAPVALSIGIGAYLLTLAVFIPVSGWVADRFGPRQVFAAAVLLFTLTSVACGLSQSLPVFVAARILQGIGGALMVPVGRLVVLRSTPKSGLVKAIATITYGVQRHVPLDAFHRLQHAGFWCGCDAGTARADRLGATAACRREPGQRAPGVNLIQQSNLKPQQ